MVDAATYTGIGPYTGNYVTLDLLSYNFSYVNQTNYRVLRLNWVIENTSADSFFDVQLVIPFVWGTIQNAVRAQIARLQQASKHG